jgi:hypothetical protein
VSEDDLEEWRKVFDFVEQLGGVEGDLIVLAEALSVDDPSAENAPWFRSSARWLRL